MIHRLLLITRATAFIAVVLAVPQRTIAAENAPAAAVDVHQVHIPTSVQAEHKEIHATLSEATKASGRVGAAAKELAAVLHPHFVREEEIALPPLGLLAPLVAGQQLPEGVVAQILPMTQSLRAELPKMLAEHKTIRQAVEKLRLAARAERATKYQRFAEELARHAQTEEEVLYPAAILVGDILLARSAKK